MRAETAFTLVHELIGVDAVIVGPAGRAQVTLILDTAAVMTTVVPSVANAVGYSDAHRVYRSVTRTAAAEERGYVVHASVDALGVTIRDHLVMVADLGYGIDGLLGINFLRHFEIGISFAKRRIVVDTPAL